MEEVLNVGSTDEHDRLTTFSNYGTCIDILAPGTNIATTGWVGIN